MTSHLPLPKANDSLPANKRLQLTAFGARDRWYFDSFRRASAAAEAQDVGRQLITTMPSIDAVDRFCSAHR